MFSQTFKNKINNILNETKLTELINIAMCSLPKLDIWEKKLLFIIRRTRNIRCKFR